MNIVLPFLANLFSSEDVLPLSPTFSRGEDGMSSLLTQGRNSSLSLEGEDWGEGNSLALPTRPSSRCSSTSCGGRSDSGSPAPIMSRLKRSKAQKAATLQEEAGAPLRLRPDEKQKIQGDKQMKLSIGKSLARFPLERNRSSDKKSHQNQKVGANSYRKSLSTFSEFALVCHYGGRAVSDESDNDKSGALTKI